MAENFRHRCRRIIFDSNKSDEKLFDILLIIAISLSVIVVLAESIESVRSQYAGLLLGLEWGFTILFTIEYIIRIWAAEKPWKYIRSFYGIIDLLAILPSYLDLLIPGARYLMLFRIVRVLRIFRVLKLVKYIGDANILLSAIAASARKIGIFIFAVLTLVTILGSVMYLIEGPDNGFTSIPKSVYWAIVTLTTVGYGDISPQTPMGQLFASIIMITGYGIIAVPTGIVTVELSKVSSAPPGKIVCDNCGAKNHPRGAIFCYNCGASLEND